jgi:methyl-accepting chemotaxis protein
MSDETFRWVIAGGVLLASLSCIIGGIMSIVLVSIAKKTKDRLDVVLDSLVPIAKDTEETISVLKPRLIKISAQAEQVSQIVANEAQRYSEVSKDLAERAKAQIARLDGAVDATVEQVQEAGGAVKSAVLRPMREIDGVFAGLRTAIATYTRGRRPAVYSATQDEEMFI